MGGVAQDGGACGRWKARAAKGGQGGAVPRPESAAGGACREWRCGTERRSVPHAGSTCRRWEVCAACRRSVPQVKEPRRDESRDFISRNHSQNSQNTRNSSCCRMQIQGARPQGVSPDPSGAVTVPAGMPAAAHAPVSCSSPAASRFPAGSDSPESLTKFTKYTEFRLLPAADSGRARRA